MFNIDETVNELMKTGGKGMTRPTEQGDFSLHDAYNVAHQLANTQRANGKTLAGRKIGISNRAAWDSLGLTDVVWGYVFSDTVFEAKQNAYTLSLDGLSQPKLEPEIVFGLNAALPAGTRNGAALLKSAEWIALGFEVVQCPYENWQFKPADLVATFGFHGALIIGEKKMIDDPEALARALVNTSATLYKDDTVVHEGGGTNVVDPPAAALGHIADLIAADGDATPLAAGELITTGTLTAAPAIGAGESYRVSVSELGLADLTLTLR